MKTVIEMAHEAGVHVYPEFEKAFEHFANLIRADEREACAKVCDDFAKYSDWPTADNCAAAIRARNAK